MKHPSQNRAGRFPPRHRPPYRHNGKGMNGSSTPQRSAAEESFLSKTSIDPKVRLRLEAGSTDLTMRAMDLICPIGRGQRGLIVSPPKAGKTTFLKQICLSLAKTELTLKLYCLLVDERPEEVTD